MGHTDQCVSHYELCMLSHKLFQTLVGIAIIFPTFSIDASIRLFIFHEQVVTDPVSCQQRVEKLFSIILKFALINAVICTTQYHITMNLFIHLWNFQQVPVKNNDDNAIVTTPMC